MITLVCTICLLAGQVEVPDEKDKQIVAKFLEHVGTLPERITKKYCRGLAAEEPEGYCWKITPQLDMTLTAYRLTGDKKHLEMFAALFDNMRAALTKGPDGYLGWYGKPLGLFRNPGKPDQKVDVIITSFRVARAVAEYVELGGEKKDHLELVEKLLVRKWRQRGNFVDLGDRGCIVRTPPQLKDVKANLTMPANKHSIIARACLALYRVTHKDLYMDLAMRLGARFKRTLTLKDGHYEWNYWDPAGDWDVHPTEKNKWKHWIGVEHRSGYYSHSVWMAVDLYHHGVVFARADMDRFVKTQLEMCWDGSVTKPKWARVDGTRSDKYMKGAYMCTHLAPFHRRIADFVFTGPRQEERLKNAGHSWQGGPVAAGWIEAKLWWASKARGGKRVLLEHAKEFLSDKKSKRSHDRLFFKVEPPGYTAPRTPSEMKD
ncbi:MAG: hypothetical protein ACYTAF_08555 [Planctomycetota bacterium]|jgi:hypothetical protein